MKSIHLTLNGKEIILNKSEDPAPWSLEDLFLYLKNNNKEELASTLSHCAVALNQNFIPKSLYAQTPLQDCDEIEIVTPFPGG